MSATHLARTSEARYQCINMLLTVDGLRPFSDFRVRKRFEIKQILGQIWLNFGFSRKFPGWDTVSQLSSLQLCMHLSIEAVVACPAARSHFYEMREATLQRSIFN